MPAKAGIHAFLDKQKESGSFLKKRTKKLLVPGRAGGTAKSPVQQAPFLAGARTTRANAPSKQKFFASFFQKRSACFP
jgi:hypothetical protein